MEKLKFTLIICSLILLAACSEDDPEVTLDIDIPENFTVDIPETISTSEDGTLSGRTDGDGDGVIEGNEIYESVRYFIHIGEDAAEILEFTLEVGRQLELANVSEITFTGDDDGREKRLTISNDVSRGGTTYQYEMKMVDVADDANALQLLWNTDPVAGFAILNPYQIDRAENANAEDVFVRIDYSESSDVYEQTMTVSISGLPAIGNGDIDNLKMFAGRNGDIVEVRGNSNHPNLVIIDEDFTGGRNYAFVGRGDDANDIGVINLALPPSDVTTSSVYDDYSVFDVLEDEIMSVGITDQNIIDAVLQNATSPAYFNRADGFLSSGPDNVPEDPNFTASFIDLSGLEPFVPNDVKTLTIEFID